MKDADLSNGETQEEDVELAMAHVPAHRLLHQSFESFRSDDRRLRVCNSSHAPPLESLFTKKDGYILLRLLLFTHMGQSLFTSKQYHCV